MRWPRRATRPRRYAGSIERRPPSSRGSGGSSRATWPGSCRRSSAAGTRPRRAGKPAAARCAAGRLGRCTHVFSSGQHGHFGSGLAQRALLDWGQVKKPPRAALSKRKVQRKQGGSRPGAGSKGSKRIRAGAPESRCGAPSRSQVKQRQPVGAAPSRRGPKPSWPTRARSRSWPWRPRSTSGPWSPC